MKPVLRRLSLCLSLCLGLLTCVATTAYGQEAAPSAPSDPPLAKGFKVGELMPVHIVGFVAGARNKGGGCPAVMISNRRLPGIEIWSTAADDATFRLAAALEAAIPEGSRSLVFLTVFADGAEDLAAKSETVALKKVFVCHSRSSARDAFNTAREGDKAEVMVFFENRKQIESRRDFAPGELTDEKIDLVVEQARQFLAEPAP
jgi:hypothetical protein